MTTPAKVRSKSYSPWVFGLGIAAIIVISVLPLLIRPDSEFSGADGLGADTVASLAPGYDPGWITNWWSPPGGETESALFALQAAIGGLLIGYFFGYLRGRQKGRTEAEAEAGPLKPE